MILIGFLDGYFLEEINYFYSKIEEKQKKTKSVVLDDGSYLRVLKLKEMANKEAPSSSPRKEMANKEAPSSSPHFGKRSTSSAHFSSSESLPSRKRRISSASSTSSSSEPSRKRVVFIGQAPGPAHPQDPPPPFAGGAEKRLARLSGYELKELWRHCDRLNLLSEYPGRKGGGRGGGGGGVGVVYDLSGAEITRYRLDPNKHFSSGDAFPHHEAEAAAAAFEKTGALQQYRLVVLLGLNVARAFGVIKPSLFASFDASSSSRGGGGGGAPVDHRRTTVLTFPHPSGVSHFWNREQNRTRATEALRCAMRSALGPVRYGAALGDLQPDDDHPARPASSQPSVISASQVSRGKSGKNLRGN